MTTNFTLNLTLVDGIAAILLLAAGGVGVLSAIRQSLRRALEDDPEALVRAVTDTSIVGALNANGAIPRTNSAYAGTNGAQPRINGAQPNADSAATDDIGGASDPADATLEAANGSRA